MSISQEMLTTIESVPYRNKKVYTQLIEFNGIPCFVLYEYGAFNYYSAWTGKQIYGFRTSLHFTTVSIPGSYLNDMLPLYPQQFTQGHTPGNFVLAKTLGNTSGYLFYFVLDITREYPNLSIAIPLVNTNLRWYSFPFDIAKLQIPFSEHFTKQTLITFAEELLKPITKSTIAWKENIWTV